MIRIMRRQERVADICQMFPAHTRGEIVEAIDAILRHTNNHDAMRHVNRVLALQASNVPLINGQEASKAADGARTLRHYGPMF